MTIEDGLYHDIRDHTYSHDRIVAIVMNPGTMYEITRDSIMLSMVRMTGNSIYQFMGIEVRLINEIPDGEWLVVCEEPCLNYGYVGDSLFVKWMFDEVDKITSQPNPYRTGFDAKRNKRFAR